MQLLVEMVYCVAHHLLIGKKLTTSVSKYFIYSQTSIIRSVRDRQIFFELSVIRIFKIGTFRKCSVVFVRY